MGAYVDTGRTRSAPSRSTAASARPPRCRGVAARRRLHVRRIRGARRTRSRVPHTSPARSGARRSGTSASCSAPSVAEAIITGGMRQSPPQPSFLDARNAILHGRHGALRRDPHQHALGRVREPRHGLLRLDRRARTDPTPRRTRFDLPPVATGQRPRRPLRRRRDAAGGARERRGAPRGSRRARRCRINASTARGRASVTVGCSSACRATATMTVSRATARFAGLGRTTRLARVTRRLAASGTADVRAEPVGRDACARRAPAGCSRWA